MIPGLRRSGIVSALLILALALFIALFDWNHLRDPIARIASERVGRPVRIEGALHADVLSLAPRLQVSELRVGNARWAGPGDMASIERLTVAIELLPLLRGELILRDLVLEKPRLDLYRNAEGRANWQRSRPTTRREGTADLPVVRRFLVYDGELKLIDRKRKLSFAGTLSASEAAADPAAQPVRLRGSGKLNGTLFGLELQGAPLINVERDEPYRFDAEVRAGETRLAARGSVPRPFDFAAYTASLIVTGDDLANLYYLTGLALPNTPPYRISGQLARDGTRFHMRGASGTVGDSDLEGEVIIETAGERPRLSATLTSRVLDLDDLAAPLGAPPASRSGETLSPTQRKAAEAMAAKRRIFPDANLEVQRVRGMDAAVRFRAQAVNTRKVPLREVAFDLTLDEGVLTLDPVSFAFPQGRLSGTVRLDARPRVPQTELDVRLTGVRLEQFRPRDARQPPVEGLLLGRARVQGRGDSVHEFVSTANGTVTLVVPRGEVREAFAELTGINVARGLGLLLTGDQTRAAVRCGVADFRVRSGNLLAQSIVFDTEDVLITGDGAIYLGPELFDMTLKGRPKEPRLLRVRTPITIRGPLRDPAIGLESDEVAAQTGIAAVLASLVAPLASVLAFIDPGLADDADCRALLTHAKNKGAVRESGS